MPQPSICSVWAQERALKGVDDMARVLIVEDDPVVGLDIAEELEENGFAVVGVAPSVSQALDIFSVHGCDVAVLDVNLGDETSAPVAALLADKGIPFVAVTGYSVDQCPAEFATVPLLRKPYRTDSLVAAINRQLACAKD
jgi:DNA-binding response OmpR family regulator